VGVNILVPGKVASKCILSLETTNLIIYLIINQENRDIKHQEFMIKEKNGIHLHYGHLKIEKMKKN